jgi:pimeloyl-ACP methyl ester carboxylesterase
MGLAYCISGLGADERIFSNLVLEGFTLKHIPWITPWKREPISQYAKRMAGGFTEAPPVLIGVSFGGMMAIEIARLLNIKKVIIISSVKSYEELPRWMKHIGRTGLNKLIPMRPYSFIQGIGDARLGVSNEEEGNMVHAYRKAADPVYLDWAVDQVLNWKNHWLPENLVHIHGDEDRIFPIHRVQPSYTIKKGTHFMVYNRAEEISRIIEKEIAAV